MVNYSAMAIHDQSIDFDRVFFALANSTRRAILQQLSQGSATVTQLSEQFTISSPAISKHLRVLEQAGLLIQKKEGRVRHCHLVVDPLAEATEWLDQYRSFWENNFDALDDFLAETGKSSLEEESPEEEGKNLP